MHGQFEVAFVVFERLIALSVEQFCAHSGCMAQRRKAQQDMGIADPLIEQRLGPFDPFVVRRPVVGVARPERQAVQPQAISRAHVAATLCEHRSQLLVDASGHASGIDPCAMLALSV
ncbi:MAG TPA: hypothetical protein VNC41_08185, partial [Acidimicrobiia bacterium]|nr:hypothetical protein [Acidimicrobiia bacterium]